jgi:hypothetical protein
VAEHLPEDVLAELDAEQRRSGRESPPPEALTHEVPEDILAEQDVQARRAEGETALRTDDEIVEIDEP